MQTLGAKGTARDGQRNAQTAKAWLNGTAKGKTKTVRGKVIANGVKVARNKSAPRLNVAYAQKMNMRIYRLHTHKYYTNTI